MSLRPVVSMSRAVSTWIGLVLVWFGAAMREPVITTSSSVVAGCSLACCWAAADPNQATAIAPSTDHAGVRDRPPFDREIRPGP